MEKTHVAGLILAMSLVAAPWLVCSTSSAGVYDPWYDLDDDGKIDIFDVVRVAGAYGSSGEPYAAKAAIAYDTGWIDITDLCGQYFDISHTLDSMDVMVDLQGKTTPDGGVHQRHLGGTGFHPGWTKTYGGSDDEYASAVIRTADGGYAVAGATFPPGPTGYSDAWLVKTDAAGNMQWNRTYGGTGHDQAAAVVQTSDGGYALAGSTTSSGSGGFDVWLMKTDGTGALEWSRAHGGSGQDYAHSVVQTTDGGYALACTTDSFGAGSWDAWLVKTYANGTFQWGITYGGTGDDSAVSLVQTVDNGYALAGYTTSFGAGNQDFWFVKTDAAGGKEWDRTYGGANTERARAVIQTEDGYALVGFTYSFGAGLYDAWLVKTGADGVMQWDRTYGGSNGDEASALVQTSDGGYALAGLTYSFGAGAGDAWLVKTDADGIQQWSRTYGEPTAGSVTSLVPTSDGGYAFVGHTLDFGSVNFDFLLVKTEAELGLMWIDSTPSSIRLYRGATDLDWNYVRVRLWKLHETP